MRPCEIMGHRVDYDSLNPKIRRVIEKRYGSDNFLFLRFLGSKPNTHEDTTPHSDYSETEIGWFGKSTKHSEHSEHTDKVYYNEYGDHEAYGEHSDHSEVASTLNRPWGA